jgi:7-cyano-7-deazaguanine synthase in queuosine biosynthesis
MAYHLYLRAPGETGRLPKGMDAVVHLGEAGARGATVHHNLERLFAFPRMPSLEAQAFLLAALGVWAADKLKPRRDAADAWSREFVVHLPGPPLCRRLAPRLASVLNFLTGDDWTLKMREAPVALNLKGAWPHSWQPQAVVLFSGGLDSLVGAIDRLAAGQRILLVSHYDYGQLAGTQQTLAAALTRHYGPERVHHLPLRVQLEAPELSLRSRSLLYLALGLTAALAFGPEAPLVVPENGWISWNAPLTLNRLGTYSTRTTHPGFLTGLTSLWREAGLGHPLHNPYEDLPKGEMLARCRDQALLKELAPLSMSCARPVASRWRRRSAGSCGYCYPCLLRRAALNRMGWDQGQDYLLDVLAAPEHLRHRSRGRDLRALLCALKTWEEAPQDLEARMWLGDTAPEALARYPQAKAVLAAGFREFARFITDKGPEWVKAYLA